MAKKAKSKFKSLSTPGNTQDLSNYLTELVMLRKNRGMKLPPYFWQQTRYKFQYKREIMACRKFIKKYGESFVLYVAMNNYIDTWTDFGRIEFKLQTLAESYSRKFLPKDLSDVKQDVVKITEDVRDFTVQKTNKYSLFKRLEELNGKKEEG